MRPWTLLLILLVTGLCWAETPSVRFRGLPAGTKVLVVPSTRNVKFRQTAEQNGTEIKESGRPIRLEVAVGDTLEFFHPHLDIEAASQSLYKCEEFGFLKDGLLELPPPRQSFTVELQPGTSHLIWYAFDYRRQYGIGILILLAFAGLTAFSGFRTRRANKTKKNWEDQRQSLVAQSDASDPLLGTILDDKYVIIDVLGKGGMAMVYSAVPKESLDTTETVAVKVIQQQFAENEEFLRRFHREVAVSKSLTHPNIVRVEDWGTHQKMLYLVLECVKGETLERMIPRSGWKLDQAMSYLSPILDGLVFAHGKGVIHRDLKPDNVMVTKGGVPKVMDFGLARSQDVSKVTKTGSALGTPAYMPPEQITGAKPTPAADQYSLGVMIYEMLTARRPFEAEDPMALVFQHLTEPPPSPLKWKPEMDPRLVELILRMLEKNPESRFESLSMVREGLMAIAAGMPWELPPKPEPRSPAPAPVKVSRAGSGDDEGTVGFHTTAPDDEGTIGFQTTASDDEGTIGFEAVKPPQ